MDCRVQRWQADRRGLPIFRMAHRSESSGKRGLPRRPQNRMGPSKSARQKCARSREIYSARIPQRMGLIKRTKTTADFMPRISEDIREIRIIRRQFTSEFLL